MFTATPVSRDRRDQFTIWNVGQGQWLTYASSDRCYHFDMGGEFAPWAKILQLCQRKENVLFLSHSDWDHISQMRKTQSLLRNLCLVSIPREYLSPKKLNFFKSFRACSEEHSTSEKIQELNFHPELHFTTTRKKPNSNRYSRVFELQNEVIIPGDSDRSAEKYWVPLIPERALRLLVLGHHGSRTSTSKVLLEKLHFSMALASARRSRYGHPHPETVERLRAKKIPILSTEQWGNITVEL